MAYITRIIEKTIQQLTHMFPVILVTGPRQVGKTTLLKELAEKAKEEEDGHRTYVTLDDPDVRFLAERDPGLFFERYQPPILLDEIQYAPSLLPYIKMRVDRSGKMGEFWLTGSQAFHLMQGVSESLAGRVGLVNLLGLSDAEIYQEPSQPYSTLPSSLLEKLKHRQARSLQDIFARIFRGSMPALYAGTPIDWETYYRSYVATYLLRDLRDLTQVADEMEFYHFMTLVAGRTGRPVIYEELAREAGITAPTAKKWLSILVSSHLVALLPPYAHNRLKRIVKMPLLHFLDTGLAAYLLKWGNPEALERGAMSGAFFESYVVGEIYKSYLNAGKTPPLYYYRDKDQKEIDLLLEENNRLFPIEIKKTASPGKKAVKNFPVLESVSQSGVEIGPGNVICLAPDLLPLDDKNWAVPAWLV